MGIHFHVPGCKRKELAQEIGTWLGCETKYLGVPSCAYRVGFATVDKDGNFTVDSAADEETVERLIEHLYDAGFESDDGESTEESRICVSVPENLLPTAAEENLRAIVTSKCGLFKAAFGVNTLPIERENGKVCFPWLRSDASPEEIRAFDRFICALCEMARNAKRVTANMPCAASCSVWDLSAKSTKKPVKSSSATWRAVPPSEAVSGRRRKYANDLKRSPTRPS